MVLIKWDFVCWMCNVHLYLYSLILLERHTFTPHERCVCNSIVCYRCLFVCFFSRLLCRKSQLAGNIDLMVVWHNSAANSKYAFRCMCGVYLHFVNVYCIFVQKVHSLARPRSRFAYQIASPFKYAIRISRNSQ